MVSDWPVRGRSAKGEPKAFSRFTRTCARCGACFIGLAPGLTGERGLWDQMTWYCSRECAPVALLQRLDKARRVARSDDSKETR